MSRLPLNSHDKRLNWDPPPPTSNKGLRDSRVHSCCYEIFKPGIKLKSKFVFLYAPLSLIQFSSVTQLCPTPCDPMNCSMPDLPVHHQHPEFTQTHFHRVGDAIQPSHPLLSPFPPAPNPSQHQSLFQ